MLIVAVNSGKINFNMDIKQEPLDDPGSETIDIKEEPLTSVKINPICEINQKSHLFQKVKEEKDTEIANGAHWPTDRGTTAAGSVYIKKDSVYISSELNMFSHEHDNKFYGNMLEIPEIHDKKVQARDLCIGNSDLVKIKQEIDLNYEVLMDECDLPTVKNKVDFLNDPCSSQQYQNSLNKNTAMHRKRKYLCPVCQKDCVSVSARVKHLTCHFGKQCVICCTSGKMFVRKDEYFNNFLKYSTNYSYRALKRTFKHAKTKKYPIKCEFCCKLIVKKWALLNHLKEHIKYEQSFLLFSKIFKKQQESRKKTKIKPLKILHKTTRRPKPHKEICSKKYSGQVNLAKHLELHSEKKPFECKICLETFPREDHLTTHVKVHVVGKLFKSKICFETSHKTRHVAHTRVPAVKKPFKCEFCCKTFSQKAHLVVHTRTHTGEKPFECKICFKTFSQTSHVVAHARTHNGEKPYQCHVCFKAFSEKNNLSKHNRIHTEEKSFECETCFKTFLEKFNLVRHKRIHTNEKPYKCETCFKAFSEKSNLLRHVRTHTKEKPFKCDVCLKGFSENSNLTKHLKLHTGDKPFGCEICFKTFWRKDQLATHAKAHNV